MKRIEDVFAREIQDLCLKKAKAIVDHIQQSGLTPVDTGRLIEGYKAERSGKGAAVTTDVDYWYYVEFGYGPEGRRTPQPHVRPAIESVRLS